MNRGKTLGFPSSRFGRVLGGFYASKGKTGFKLKRRIKVKSWVQAGVDGSSEEVDGGSTSGADEINGGLKSDQPKMLFASGADEMDEDMKSDQPKMLFAGREKIGADVHRKEQKWDYLMVLLKDQKRRFSEMALQYYNSKKNCQFEFVQAMHSEDLMLCSSDSVEEWCHISFIARPKSGKGENISLLS